MESETIIHMKTLFSFSSLLIVAVCFSSCLRYQYITLASDTPQNKAKEFVIENDTLTLKYSFSGEGGPMHIYVFNKLTTPIYIDWTKSSIIRDNQSDGYVTGYATLSGTVTGASYRAGNNYSLNSASVNGNIHSDIETSFIPPKTFIEVSKKLVHTQFIELPLTKREKKQTKTSLGSVINIETINFDEANSPLKFRSFITVSTDNNNSFHFDNRFWASETMESVSNPDELQNRANNQFYVSKLTGFGGVMLFLGVVTLLGFGAASKAHN